MNDNSYLYVVSTPIGSWDDITVRALNTLREATIIACEDTRETKQLLDHFEIDVEGKRLLSYHAQSKSSREDEIVGLLQDGISVTLVSDRGTPGISDPGSRLIARAIDLGVVIVPIPGAAAFVAALTASGADTSAFEYVGFIPHKKGRQTLFAKMMTANHTIVAYESPHRLLKTLEALKDCPKQLIVARELTKLHEEFVRGTCAEVFAEFSSRDKILGEFVIILDAK
jgi:16S rRNA (cytidine1402-2'-O)-methyltransferase